MIRWRMATKQRAAAPAGDAGLGRAARRGLVRPRAGVATAPVLAALAVLAGLGAVAARGGRPAPDMGAGVAVPAAQGARAALQDPPEDPAPLPGVLCRVVGAGLVVEAEPGDAAWGRIQNAGTATVVLTAVEVGWTGDAELQAIMVRSGGAQRDVAAGAFASPALVTLGEAVPLEPGAVLEVGLRVRAAGGGAPWVPHLIVGYFAEGCRVAILPEAAPRCPLEAETPVPVPGGRRVDVALRAAGAVGDTVVALEVDWPAATNGALRALTLDDAPLVDFGDALAFAPATIDLERWLGHGIALAPGRRVRLGFEFQNPVAGGDYAVAASTAAGCTVTGSTWVAAPECGVTADAFRVSAGSARLRLSNPRDIPRALSTVEAFWPAGDGAAVVELLADGRVVWRGREERSPAVLRLPEPVVVPGRSAVELALRIEGREGAAPGDDGAAVRGAFTIVAGFEGGCRVVYTSVPAPESCDLSAGALVAVPAERTVTVAVGNGGADAVLAALAIGWNPRNGPLTSVEWDGVPLLPEPVRWSAVPHALSLPAGQRPPLARNDPASLVLRFADGAAPDGYTIEMQLATAGGEPCDALWVTVPERVPNACPQAIDGLDVAGTILSASVRNDGASDVLRWLELSWPDAQAMPALVEVAALPEGAAQPRVLWTGSSTSSGARIDLGGTAAVAGGSSTLLRLRFAAPLDVPGDPARVLALVIGFDSGCRARGATGGAPSNRVSFDGVLVGPLPAPLTRCCWRVQRLRADDALEIIDVQVTDATRIEPAGIAPRPGDPVTVEALVQNDGRLEAERVAVHRASRRVRLMGTLQKVGAVDPGTGRPTHVVLLDRIARIDASTLIQGRPAIGAYALVEGEENPDATLTAATLVMAGTDDEVSYVTGRRGVVQDAAFVGSEDDCVQRWRVDHYIVNVPRDAWNDPGGQCVRPARGDRVEISGGRLLSGGQTGGQEVIDATGVRLLTRRADRERSLREAVGRLVAVPEGGLLGTWRIAVPGGEELAFEVRSLAVVDLRLAPADPRAGIAVHVRLQDEPGGVPLALRVRTDWLD